jgi:hypothetical protein
MQFNSNNKNNKSEKRSFMENARRSLERLIGPPLLLDEQTVSTPPILTPLGRKHRQLEIRLLQSLRHSDEAIDELMALWMQASAIEAASAKYNDYSPDEDDDVVEYTLAQTKGAVLALHWMDNQCDRRHAELTLRELIKQYPTWTEPPARLALLLFYNGRYAESYKFNQVVLGMKPWHFEALQLQVLLFLVSSDRAGAIWAARCGLPPLHQAKKRQSWIQKAVAMASDQLLSLEQEHEHQKQQKLLTRMVHATGAAPGMPSTSFFTDVKAFAPDENAWQ